MTAYPAKTALAVAIVSAAMYGCATRVEMGPGYYHYDTGIAHPAVPPAYDSMADTYSPPVTYQAPSTYVPPAPSIYVAPGTTYYQAPAAISDGYPTGAYSNRPVVIVPSTRGYLPRARLRRTATPVSSWDT